MKEITMNARKINLVSYDEKYYENIFEWFSENQIKDLYYTETSNFNKAQLYEKLEKEISNMYHSFFVVLEMTTNIPVGIIYSYNYEPDSGIIYVNMFLEKEKNDLEEECMLSFVKYLFTYYSLRKIYMHMYDYNYEKSKKFGEIGFKLIGKLQEYTYYKGKYRDVLLLELNRNEYNRKLNENKTKI